MQNTNYLCSMCLGTHPSMLLWDRRLVVANLRLRWWCLKEKTNTILEIENSATGVRWTILATQWYKFQGVRGECCINTEPHQSTSCDTAKIYQFVYSLPLLIMVAFLLTWTIRVWYIFSNFLLPLLKFLVDFWGLLVTLANTISYFLPCLDKKR